MSLVNNTVDKNSRVHAAQINNFKYFISGTLCSIVPFLVYHISNTILDPYFAIVVCQITSVFVSMLVPMQMRFIFRYMIPILIAPFEFEYIQSGLHLKTSFVGKSCERYGDLTLLLLPAYCIVGRLYVRLAVGNFVCFFLFFFFKWSFPYRHIRIIGYINLCLVNAFTLTYYIYIYIVIIYVFNGWLYFLVRSDIDNSSISIEVTDIFRDKDYVLKHLQPFERTISWEIYRHNSRDSWSYTGFDAKFDDDKLPVCKGIYYRIEGEDVVITCKINNTYGMVEVNGGSTINCMSFPVFDHIQWYLGSGLTTGLLKVSPKIKPNNVSELTLRITDLKAEHFKHEITLWGLFNQGGTLRVKFGSFFINKQKEISKYVHVPQGHIVSYKEMPFYSFSDIQSNMYTADSRSFVSLIFSTLNTNAVYFDIDKGCGPMIRVLFDMSKIGDIFYETPIV